MERVALKEIFWIFAKIGAFTIGGGYAMIPLIQHEISRRGWLEDEVIDDAVVLAQSAPGLLAVNMAIFTGYRLRGIKGSIAATLGAILPSFIIILLVAAVFSSIRDNKVIENIFKGLRPAVVGLIFAPMVKMARKGNRTWWAWTISIATMLLIAFLKVSPIYILLVLITGAVAISLLRQKKEGGR